MNRAIVIGCHVNGLGVIRSLAARKLGIIALWYDPGSDFAHRSRHVSRHLRVPHPRSEPTAFIDILTHNSARWRDALLIDTNDDVAIALSRHREQLLEHYRVITPPWRVLSKFIEKSQTYGLAEACGVPYPKTFVPETSAGLAALPDQITFPCIIKPVVGHLFFSHFQRKNFVVSDRGELEAKFELSARSGHDVMVQEIVPGPDSDIFQCAMYFDSSGRLAATFFMRKIRQNPPKFGVARVAVSHAPIRQIGEWTERMLREIGFKGIAHAEFKRDARDGEFKLIEINGRLARANWLSATCGVNLPWIAHLDLVQKQQVTAGDYHKDVYWIELSEDVANSLAHRRQEMFTIREYIRPYLAADKTFADVSVRDPAPFIQRLLNLASIRRVRTDAPGGIS